MQTRLPASAVLVAAFLAGGYPVGVGSYLCAAVWLALALAAAWRPPPAPSAAVLALLALAALTLLSGLWGTWHEALGVVQLPLLYAGLVWSAEWAGTPALDGLRVAIAAVAAAGVAGRVTGLAAPSPEPGSVRMAWPIGYADGLGLLCALGVVLCAARRRWWPLGAICAVALVWTLSRSAIAACLVGLGALAVLQGLVPRRVALVGGAALLAAAVLLARPAYDRFQSPAPDTRGVSRLATVSGHGRTHLWRAALVEGADHPLAGGGAGSWRRAAGAQVANPHSLELQTFAELGLAGVAALAVFLVAVLRRPREPAAWSAFLSWAIAAAVDWDWQLPAVTGAGMVCAGTLTATGRPLGPRAAVAAAGGALVLGAAALARVVTT